MNITGLMSQQQVADALIRMFNTKIDIFLPKMATQCRRSSKWEFGNTRRIEHSINNMICNITWNGEKSYSYYFYHINHFHTFVLHVASSLKDYTYCTYETSKPRIRAHFSPIQDYNKYMTDMLLTCICIMDVKAQPSCTRIRSKHRRQEICTA